MEGSVVFKGRLTYSKQAKSMTLQSSTELPNPPKKKERKKKDKTNKIFLLLPVIAPPPENQSTDGAEALAAIQRIALPDRIYPMLIHTSIKICT